MTNWESNKGNLYSAPIDSRRGLEAQRRSESPVGCFDPTREVDQNAIKGNKKYFFKTLSYI